MACTSTDNPGVANVMTALEEHLLLLLSDPVLPSVTTIVAGEVVRGSWWAHHASQRIFQTASILEEDKNVLAVKLVSAKVTFVYSDLWPQLISIARAREPWQMKHLAAKDLRLLELVDQHGSLAIGNPRIAEAGLSAGEARAAARTLESSLLVYSTSEHTAGGRHERWLSRWDVWQKSKTNAPLRNLPTPTSARTQLEGLVKNMNVTFGARAWLPWQKV
jgi:hypothetical protein